MRFDDLDARMRVFETAHDLCVLPGVYMVARLDGRGFTKFTSERNFSKPFDAKFHEFMCAVTAGLMSDEGMDFLYGYTQSDEISLLFKRDSGVFARKLRKLNSVLAGAASARGTLHQGVLCTFDCRISQLPSLFDVHDYFNWRMEDSARNALNGYCYWLQVQNGKSRRQATKALEGKGTSYKNEMLFSTFGVNFNDVPSWQRRGTGFCYDKVERLGYNPITQKKEMATRRVLTEHRELPMGQEFRDFLTKVVSDAEES